MKKVEKLTGIQKNSKITEAILVFKTEDDQVLISQDVTINDCKYSTEDYTPTTILKMLNFAAMAVLNSVESE